MASNSKIMPFMEGRNGRLLFVQNRVPKSYAWKTWSIKPIVVKHADGVNGEKRARLSKTLDYYELTAQMYVKDAEWLRDWLEAQAAEDAMTAPLDQEGAIRLNPNNGTRKSFILEELIWDDWDFSQGGRTEKKMVNVNMRCTDIKEGKAI
jgi:hypothetical protein